MHVTFKGGKQRRDIPVLNNRVVKRGGRQRRVCGYVWVRGHWNITIVIAEVLSLSHST